MVALAPPTVCGPLLATSPIVRVRGVVAGADVTVQSTTGTVHAQGPASLNGDVELSVTRPFRAGDELVASQKRGADASASSAHACPVVEPPRDLPRPVFETLLNQCTADVLLSGLVPGARVTVKRGPTVLGQDDVRYPWQWVRLTGALSAGQTLQASQTLAGSNPSPIGQSELVVTVDIEHGVPSPQVVQPVSACQGSIDVVGAVPTASVVAVFDDGGTTTWTAPAAAFTATLLAPLRQGGFAIRQTLRACGYTSADTKVAVGAERRPDAPRPQVYCPESRRVRVDGLVTGAAVEFATAVWSSSGWSSETPLMVAGAAAPSQDFDLPAVVGGSGPLMGIFVRQRTCTLTSDAGTAPEFSRPGSGALAPPPAAIVAPVYSCSRTVVVDPSGWGLGVLRSARTGAALADAFTPPPGRAMVVRPWFPLEAGDELYVDYSGCGAGRQTAHVQVQQVPATLPDLRIVPPVPGDNVLSVSGALPGARVIAMIGLARVAMATTVDGTATVPMGRALADGESVWAYQRLCGASGNVEGSIRVARAALSVVVAPASTVEGTATSLTVTAKRADTGEALTGLAVQLAGQSVGVTGTAFTWTPGAPGAVAGKVVGGSKYLDAPFSVTVAPKPVVPTLSISLGGVGGYGNPVVVNRVSWRLQPSWNAPAVTVSGVTASATLGPIPAGTSNPTVAVSLDAFEATRTEQGVAFKVWPHADSPLARVAFTKTSMHVGFLLTTQLVDVYDANGNYVDTVWQGNIAYAGAS